MLRSFRPCMVFETENRFWTIGRGAVAKVDKNLPARALSLFLQLT